MMKWREHVRAASQLTTPQMFYSIDQIIYSRDNTARKCFDCRFVFAMTASGSSAKKQWRQVEMYMERHHRVGILKHSDW